MRLDLGPEEARAIAEDAYVAAYPVAHSYWRFWSTTQDPASPGLTFVNQLTPGRTPPGTGPGLLAPGHRPALADPGTVASVGWCDLRREPLVLTTPEVPPGRYHSVRFADASGQTFATMGRRPNGDGATTAIVAGPGWDGFRPATADLVIHSPSDLVELTVRVGFDGPYDLPGANAVQDGYHLTPLSEWRGQEPPDPPPLTAWPEMPAWALDGGPKLFEFFAWWAPFAPLGHIGATLLDRLADLGVRPGERWSASTVPGALAFAVDDGTHRAHARIVARARAAERRVSGWVPGPLAGRRSGDDPASPDELLALAAATMAGPEPDPDEVMTFVATLDAGDVPLDAGTADYRLVLGDDVPRGHSWSLTVYDGETVALVDNEIDRHSVGERSPHLDRSATGTATVRFGVEPPDRSGLGNWLPTPAGPFLVVLRLYQPRPDALDGRWSPPPLERLPRLSGLSRPDDPLRWPTKAV